MPSTIAGATTVKDVLAELDPGSQRFETVGFGEEKVARPALRSANPRSNKRSRQQRWT